MASVRRRRVVTAKVVKPTVVPHAFEPDETLAPDYHGARVCGACGKLGQAGDVQHPHGTLPLELDARRLGESP